jgi:hypothetical protein
MSLEPYEFSQITVPVLDDDVYLQYFAIPETSLNLDGNNTWQGQSPLLSFLTNTVQSFACMVANSNISISMKLSCDTTYCTQICNESRCPHQNSNATTCDYDSTMNIYPLEAATLVLCSGDTGSASEEEIFY